VTQIAADALEGFNPGHDLCRYCVNAAVLLLAARHGKRVESLDFALDGATAHEAPLPPGAVHLELDASAVRAKLEDVSRYSELRADVATLLARHGEAALAREVLRPAAPHEGLVALEREPPYYEVVGEERRAMGVYTEVLRYREHLQPLVRSLWNELGLPWPGEGRVS